MEYQFFSKLSSAFKRGLEKRMNDGEIDWYDLELIPDDYRIIISLRKPVSANVIKCSLKIPNKTPEIK